MNRLADKVVLVTGSTMGIGRQIAVTAAAEGAAVVVTGRTAEKGEAVTVGIRDEGGEAMYVQMDVTEPDTVASAFERAVAQYGKLDGVVNNVANMALGRRDRPVTELPLEDWNLIIASDLTSTFLGMKHGIRAMLAGGRGGSVVNIASEAGLRGINGVDGYTASKGGMIALTRSVASYYARYDVRCNTLAVGFVNTGGDRISEQLQDDVFRTRIQTHHLGYLATPDDIAPAAVFLLSDESRYISGTTIPVDGGAVAASHIARPFTPDIEGLPRTRAGAPEC